MQTSVVPIKKVEVGPLTMDALMWLEERGISSVVAEAAGIGSGRAFFRKLNKEADAVGFVYRHKDNDYAVKWRMRFPFGKLAWPLPRFRPVRLKPTRRMMPRALNGWRITTNY